MSRRESLPVFTPFSMMRRLTDELDRVFEGFGMPLARVGASGGSAERFVPEIDIFERNGKLVVRGDLPGMSKDDVTVNITDRSLIIEGERRFEHEESDENVYRVERSFGRFRREIPLPEGVNPESATAVVNNGVLEVELELPKSSQGRRQIPVQGQSIQAQGGTGPKPGQAA